MRIRSSALGIAAGIVLTSSAASAALCTRLPLSDVALNQADATASARKKLGAYAIEKLRERGWSGDGEITRRNETVLCTPYFSFGAIEAGFRCRVTATFCVKSAPTLQAGATAPATRGVPVPRPTKRPALARPAAPGRAAGRPDSPRQTATTERSGSAPAERIVKLRLKGSSYEISGVLKKYDKVSYIIAPPDSGNITVPADRFDCVSGACPKTTN